jgi:Uma2 family endonuclease
MSTAVATEARRYTPEDLLAMPDGKRFELVRGRLVERNMGAESSEIGGNLYFRLRLFCQEHDLGIVWPADNGYQCFPHAPGLVRRPDVSFIRRGRLPGDVSPKGWVRIPPDLAIEVVSPNDPAEDLEEKLRDYRKAGVPLIWVIYPELRMARVLRRDGTPADLEEADILSGEDVIPGFQCSLRDILPRQSTAVETRTTPTDPNGSGAG